MFCGPEEWKYCQEEKMTCVGCFYEKEVWKDIEDYKRNISNQQFRKNKKFEIYERKDIET